MAAPKHSMHDSNRWDAHAEEYAKIIARRDKSAPSPMTVPITTLIQVLNDVKPLSTATAIMDAGCGTGQAMSTLLETYGLELPSTARIIASDFSQGMVEHFRKEAAANAAEGNQIWSRLETRVLDLQNLSSLPDGSLSHVFSSFVFGIVPDNRKALAEVNRVLAPGGVLVEVTWSKITWIQWITENVEKRFPGKTQAMPWPEELKSRQGVESLLEEAEFAKVETQFVEGTLGTESVKHFITTFSKSNNPGMRSAFVNLNDTELEEAEKYLEEELLKKFPDEKVRFTGEAIICLGFKK